MLADGEAAVPVRRWQRVQWQYPAARAGSVSSKRTPPHRQRPVIEGSVMPAGLPREVAVDQLDPVAVGIGDEADPVLRPAARVIRRLLRLDALRRRAAPSRPSRSSTLSATCP